MRGEALSTEHEVVMVRLPQSCIRRNVPMYCKLLYTILSLSDPRAFEGQLLKCGQRVPESELWPAPDWPLVPILLECAGPDGRGRGHRRSAYLYVLWRYETGEWVEIARTRAIGAEWVQDLVDVAKRELGSEPPVGPGELARQMIDDLDRQLTRLENKFQLQVLSVLYTEVLGRLAIRS